MKSPDEYAEPAERALAKAGITEDTATYPVFGHWGTAAQVYAMLAQASALKMVAFTR